jgi:hypothetical protein
MTFWPSAVLLIEQIGYASLSIGTSPPAGLRFQRERSVTDDLAERLRQNDGGSVLISFRSSRGMLYAVEVIRVEKNSLIGRVLPERAEREWTLDDIEEIRTET